jgi:hypothetical protein
MEENTAREQPVVEFAVKIAYEDYKKYYWFWMWSERKRYFWYIGIWSLLCIAVDFLAFASSRPWHFLLALLVLIAIWVMRLTEPKRIYKRSHAAFSALASYAFFEDHLHVLINDKDADHETVARYDRYEKAVETAHAFYLKTPNKGYINLPKRFMTDRQIPALRELFTRRLGEKFKQYSQK